MSRNHDPIADSPIVRVLLGAKKWEKLQPTEAATRLGRLAQDSPALRRVIPSHTLTALLLACPESASGQLTFLGRVAAHLVAEASAHVPDYSELPMTAWESRVRFGRIHDFSDYFLDADDFTDRELFLTAIASEHPYNCQDELAEILGQAEAASTLFCDEEAAEVNLGRWLSHGGARDGFGSWHAWLRLIIHDGEAHFREFHAMGEGSASTRHEAPMPRQTAPVRQSNGPVSGLTDLLARCGPNGVEDAVMRYRRVWGRRSLWRILPTETVAELVHREVSSLDSSEITSDEERILLFNVAELIDLDRYSPPFGELPMDVWEVGERFPALCHAAATASADGLPDAFRQASPRRKRVALAALLGEATEALAMFPDRAQAETNLGPALGPGVRDWLEFVRTRGRSEVG